MFAAGSANNPSLPGGGGCADVREPYHSRVHVRGILFLDYVRMLRAHKGAGWEAKLEPEDLPYLQQRIDPDGWYPMTTFERFGNAILHHVAGDQLMPVQVWGKFSVHALHAANPMLLCSGDPVETLRRFHVYRQTFFDFDALDVLMLHEEEAQIAITYHMGMPAEEAASVQTLGFFQGLLELAGARDIHAVLRTKSWNGDPRTILDLRWTTPAPGR